MSRMPTLYVRNVPEEVYERLRERARRNGHSVNAEAVEILREAAAPESATPLTDRLVELGKRFKLQPGDPMPEEIIREVRDSR